MHMSSSGFFSLNHLFQVLTITILIIAAIAAVVIDVTGEAISGLFLFYIFLTTAMVFGVVSSYFVTLYPTSYRWECPYSSCTPFSLNEFALSFWLILFYVCLLVFSVTMIPNILFQTDLNNISRCCMMIHYQQY